jgi:hypothetical protein
MMITDKLPDTGINSESSKPGLQHLCNFTQRLADKQSALPHQFYLFICFYDHHNASCKFNQLTPVFKRAVHKQKPGKNYSPGSEIYNED